MKLKMPSPDTMDKIVLIVAVLGIAVIFLTLRNVPTPDEYHADVNLSRRNESLTNCN